MKKVIQWEGCEFFFLVSPQETSAELNGSPEACEPTSLCSRTSGLPFELLPPLRPCFPSPGNLEVTLS